jgi:hypothetical protein
MGSGLLSSATEPLFLSIVVTSRNDDHGGSLLRRTQTFVNAIAAQVNRYGLSAELIMVEWNPPHDRPPLREALQWPSDLGCLQVRHIEVPPAIHARYRHADALPLYQMIGKNVGIRRAQGKYVLATNIDILFSNELVRFLASRELKPGNMYRIDRHDVMTDVPVVGTIEERLSYCENHLLRLNAREGTYHVTPHGEFALAPNDIADPSSGIVLGSGWFPAESDGSLCARWVSYEANVTVTTPPEPVPPLVFDIEPGPSMRANTFQLQFVNEQGVVLTQARVTGRCIVELHLPGGSTESFRLRTTEGGFPVRYNPRVLNFRVYRCEWGAPYKIDESAVSESSAPCPAPESPATAQIAPEKSAACTSTSNTPPEEDAAASTNAIIETAQDQSVATPHVAQSIPEETADGIPSAAEDVPREVAPPMESEPRAGVVTPQTTAAAPAEAPVYTTSVRPAHAGRHYLPIVIGKMLGVLRRAAEEGPVITVWVPVPSLVRRVLRVCFGLSNQSEATLELAATAAEPAAQSQNGKPLDGLPAAARPRDTELFRTAAAAQRPSFDIPGAMPPQSSDPSHQDAAAAPLCSQPSSDIPVPPEPELSGEAASVQCAEPEQRVETAVHAENQPQPPAVEASAPSRNEPAADPPTLLRPIDDPTSDYYYQPSDLHTNGCGDFTLMAREHWFDLRGYPEMDMYSFHIDSVLCFAAHHAGFREVVLRDPLRIYHIEHGRGSGWTPEGENQLFARLRAKGVPWLEYQEVIMWAAQMRRMEAPLIFNRPDWGMRDLDLPETTI